MSVFFLKIKTRLWRNKMRSINAMQNRHIKSVNLDKANNISVYIYFSDIEQYKEAILFADNLYNAHKNVRVLVFIPKQYLTKSKTNDIVSPEVKHLLQERESTTFNKEESLKDKYPIYVIAETDLEFNFVPNKLKNEQVSVFFNSNTDIFFDTSKTFHKIDLYATLLSSAGFKIGFAKNSDTGLNPYDLLLSSSENCTYKEELNLLLHYIDIF